MHVNILGGEELINGGTLTWTTQTLSYQISCLEILICFTSEHMQVWWLMEPLFFWHSSGQQKHECRPSACWIEDLCTISRFLEHVWLITPYSICGMQLLMYDIDSCFCHTSHELCLRNRKYMYFHFNLSWPSDAIWWHWSRSTLVQVMACCLTAPSHHLIYFQWGPVTLNWEQCHRKCSITKCVCKWWI